jgi:hypothetical protein
MAHNIKESEILTYISEHKLNSKTRQRTVIDPRNFLINILYHLFDYAEEDIAPIVDRDRTSVWHSKNQAFYLWDNESYRKHTKKVREAFPDWIPPNPREKDKKEGIRKIGITINVTKEEFVKLHKARKQKGVRNMSTAMKILLFEKINELLK